MGGFLVLGRVSVVNTQSNSPAGAGGLHRVGVIGGDGIGIEVIAEALKVIRAAGVELDTVDYDLGGARYLRDGVVLSDETVEEWRSLDALLLGAVGAPGVPPGIIERGLLLKMRFDLDLYINQRPFLAPDGTHDFGRVRSGRRHCCY